eukprot:scaffold310795_cov16-Prasinocladus_malaysianus.AAC.1
MVDSESGDDSGLGCDELRLSQQPLLQGLTLQDADEIAEGEEYAAIIAADEDDDDDDEYEDGDNDK